MRVRRQQRITFEGKDRGRDKGEQSDRKIKRRRRERFVRDSCCGFQNVDLPVVGARRDESESFAEAASVLFVGISLGIFYCTFCV